MSRPARDRLLDIQEAIRRIDDYRPSLDGPHSEMAMSAILREIGVIGEAVNTLPSDVLAKRPEVPWRNIAGMRNFLVHRYFRIDQSTVRDVLTNDLSPLSLAVRALLADDD